MAMSAKENFLTGIWFTGIDALMQRTTVNQPYTTSAVKLAGLAVKLGFTRLKIRGIKKFIWDRRRFFVKR